MLANADIIRLGLQVQDSRGSAGNRGSTLLYM